MSTTRLKTLYFLSLSLFVWSLVSVALVLLRSSYRAQFDDVRVNTLAIDLALLSPLLMSFLTARLWSEKRMLLLTERVVGVILFPFALFVMVSSGPTILSGVDHSFEPIATLSLSRLKKIVGYRVNLGAGSDSGVQVQEETSFLGFKVVKRLANQYHAAISSLACGKTRSYIASSLLRTRKSILLGIPEWILRFSPQD